MTDIPPLNPFSINKCISGSVNNSNVTHDIFNAASQDNLGAEKQ